MRPSALWAEVQTTLGELRLVSDGASLTGLYFPGHRPAPRISGDAIERSDLPIFDQTANQIREFLSGVRRAFDLPILLAGTPLQTAVWESLQAIPYGQTITYGELATRVGRPDAVRAVAGAVARNPISIVVPCHRVVGANGSLTGFAGGIDRKAALLRLESGISEQPQAQLELGF